MPSAWTQGLWSNIYNSVLSAVGTPLRAGASNLTLMIERPIATWMGAKLAGDVISERIQILGLQGQIRVEIIGAGSVHFSMDEKSSYHLPENGDYRVRTSAIYPQKYQAQQMVDEVMSLYCCGPAAGGGGRGYVTPQSSTASILVDRSIVDPNIKIRIF